MADSAAARNSCSRRRASRRQFLDFDGVSTLILFQSLAALAAEPRGVAIHPTAKRIRARPHELVDARWSVGFVRAQSIEIAIRLPVSAASKQTAKDRDRSDGEDCEDEHSQPHGSTGR